MKQKTVLILLAVVLFAGCSHLQEATQESFESMGEGIFANFVFYVSKDIMLREIVDLGGNLEQTGTGTVTLFNREVLLNHTTHGRVLRATHDRLDVAFEELEGGTKPTISFVQKTDSTDKRYYIDFTMSDVVLVDEKGAYGYIKKAGPVISYNNSKYLIVYSGEEVPYLLHDLDIRIKNESRSIHGL
jgi:hypothetical protein